MPVHLLVGVVGLLFVAGGIAGIGAAVIRWRREKAAGVGHRFVTGRIAALPAVG